MSKKIIFVGPPGAGKTTLRKIFFEGESASLLLEYALEPTYGQETILMKLSEDVGIFDLAGQENYRWFETEEKSIFYGSKIILVVIDARTSIDDILEFVKKIIKIRNDLNLSSAIFLLIHKIDLISLRKLNEMKSIINETLATEDSIKILYTSIKEQYFTQTFSFFIDILKTCLQDIKPSEKLDLNLLEDVVKILYQINKDVVITKTDLISKLNIPENVIDSILANLREKGHIENSTVQDESVITLSEKGKKHYSEFLKKFSFEQFVDIEKKITSSKELVLDLETPPFIGCFIADKDGRTLLTLEIAEGALDRFLKGAPETLEEDDIMDIELIPMFISALEKFSKEINIEDLSGFNLKGSNLKMHIFGFEKYTVTFFMNPDVNIKPFVKEIINFFNNLFEKHHDAFNFSVSTGSLDEISYLQKECDAWLHNLNEKYKNMTITMDIFDMKQAKNLYLKLDKIHDLINKELLIDQEKIKKLKINLMKSVLNENLEDFKRIARVAQNLIVKYSF
ncbi:MAG: ADP-ribosylation factor-like protein [Promethearchaeota archaeon]